MSGTKRRQHHVWQYHLKAWATDGMLWCRQDGKIFSSSPTNLAVEREYYRLRELSDLEMKFVRAISLSGRSEFIRDITENTLDFIRHPHDLMREMMSAYPGGADSLPTDMIEINYVEEFFAYIETQMCPVLDKIRQGDLSSASCPGEAPWLAFFLAIQYLRTKSSERRFLDRVDSMDLHSEMDWTRVWSALRIVMIHQVAAGLNDRLEHVAWTIMEPPDDMNFVTSDQPLFNTKGNEVCDDGYVQEFVVYFPVGPRCALLCDFDSVVPSTRKCDVAASEVRRLNQAIADQAYRQVFALRRAELDQLS
jgi:hypothetical protein